MTRLTGTYRLQLRPEFGFDAARARVAYLRALGVSHLYLSPIAEARAGSTHGYDGTDPTRVRGELGGEGAFRRLALAARGAGLGVIIDIVPNHVAADVANPWWAQMLEAGPGSAGAAFFDVDWEAGGGKIILPVLGRPGEEAIAARELRLEEGPPARVRYFDRWFPIAAGTLAGSVEETLSRQHYRLEFWRTGARAVNYRRFFDINDLAGLRVEDERIFEAVHELPLRLLREGLIDGLRIDHVDGLARPTEYLRRLRERVDGASADPERRIILVEKILAEDERLPAEWPVDGTTGYEFINVVQMALVERAGATVIEAAARDVGAASPSFDDLAHTCKTEAALTLLEPDLKRVVALVRAAMAAAGVAAGAAPSDEELAGSIVGLSAALGVYRTYIESLPPAAADIDRIDRAVAECSARGAAPHRLVVALVRGEAPFAAAGPVRAAALRAIARWQQFTGPLAAKGVEDTALYRHIGLAPLNEVGGPAVVPADGVGHFHGAMTERAALMPRGLNASATHDTKRGEDTRLRILVQSEAAKDWVGAIRRWRDRHAPLRGGGAAPVLTPGDELLFYQSFLGVWPDDGAGPAAVASRLGDYLVKAAREAKVRTSWLKPDEAYEQGLRGFVEALALGAAGEGFRTEARVIRAATARAAAVASLAQVALKALSPGVPDVYQGTEVWDTALVDPDNRRAVDYDRLTELVAMLDGGGAEAKVEALLADWPSGAVKLHTLRVALRARAALGPEPAEYLPLAVDGPRAGHLLAFGRRGLGGCAVVIVPRCAAGLVPPDRFPLGADAWAGTQVRLPAGFPGLLANLITGDNVECAGSVVAVERALARFPVAILHADL